MARLSILLITRRPAELQPLIDEINGASGVHLTIAPTMKAGLDEVEQSNPALVVVDECPGEISALEAVRRIICINAFLHTAVLSDAGEEDFHGRSEGLGILMRLPSRPQKEDARRLLELLRRQL